MATHRKVAQPIPSSTPLTSLQLELLKLYSTELTEEELREVKRELARHFAHKATESADRIWDQRGLSDEEMSRWLHG